MTQMVGSYTTDCNQSPIDKDFFNLCRKFSPDGAFIHCTFSTMFYQTISDDDNRAVSTLVILLLTLLPLVKTSSEEATPVSDNGHHAFQRMGQRMGAILRGHLVRRQERSRARKEICYDMVGCFTAARSRHSPLKKSPQSPDDVDTKFWLLTRQNPIKPQLLHYGDKRESIVMSNYDPKKGTKILSHGFKGSVKDPGVPIFSDAMLKLEDTNIILVDWEKGAAGPSYALAAANTQLIGRQLALLLLDMASLQARPADIHIFGFSLGAHIAGFAGRAVQQRGIKVGRITGLDPASPLFGQLLSTSFPALNPADASLVDVIHTDGARGLANGFGLSNPIGHMDYFPNGGRDQPGCAHHRASLLVSHFEGTVNSSLVCNHVRAWHLLLETIQVGECQFLGFHCPAGHDSFEQGRCFPGRCDVNATDGSCGTMGYRAVNSSARGTLYLVTRDSRPYCGTQLRASVLLSHRTRRTRGYLQLLLLHGNESTNFQLYCELADTVEGGLSLHALAAARYASISPQLTPNLTAHFSYRSLSFQTEESHEPAGEDTVYIDEVTIQDLNGNIWRYCKKETVLENKDGSQFVVVTVPLVLNGC